MGFLWRVIAYDVGCPTFHGLSDVAESAMHIIHTLKALIKTCWGGKGGVPMERLSLGVLIVKFFNDGFSGHRSRREAE